MNILSPARAKTYFFSLGTPWQFTKTCKLVNAPSQSYSNSSAITRPLNDHAPTPADFKPPMTPTSSHFFTILISQLRLSTSYLYFSRFLLTQIFAPTDKYILDIESFVELTLFLNSKNSGNCTKMQLIVVRFIPVFNSKDTCIEDLPIEAFVVF